MQRIDVIKRKIKTANDLHSIVKTMKGLAAVSINQYDEAVACISAYFETIEQGLRIMLKKQPGVSALLQPSDPNETTKRVIIIFGSGQPMCGSFNEVLVNSVKKIWDNNHLYVPDKVAVLGTRVIPGLERINWKIDHHFDVPSTLEAINETVQALVVTIYHWYSEEHFQEVYLFYNKPNSKSQYQSTVQQLLPLNSEWLRKFSLEPWKSRTLPMYTMDVEPLFSALVREFLFVSIYRAFSESLSAENNSRLAAMQMAEKKIEEKLDDLVNIYRNQRQINITEEILDIMASFEVLKEG